MTCLIAAVALLPTQAPLIPPGAKLEKAADGFVFTEGPIWLRSGKLLFSDIPANTLYTLEGGKGVVYRKPSNNANGNQLDPQGRLLTAEHGTRRITRTDLKDGTFEVLADRFNGMRFNSPNDLVVGKDGSIFFTDPPYGIRRDQEELGFYGVFRIRPTGTLQLLSRDFERPNGIALSPDERTLYVADTARKHIRAFGFGPGRELTNGRVFYTWTSDKPGAADGMRVDRQGNVWATGPGGVTVLSPEGKVLAEIEVPKGATNVGWGDADAKTLYITSNDVVWKIRTNAVGLRW